MMLSSKDINLIKSKRIVSLFSGAGGLDLGFEQAGFDIIWANDYEEDFWDTYEYNFPDTELIKESIKNVESSEIPRCLGILGGPPCQSWSLAGSMRGIEDNRGKVFYEYLRILKDKKPLFFLAENVPGIISKTHIDEFKKILREFQSIGYGVTYKKLNAANFGVPQSRRRVFIIGYRDDLGIEFSFPEPTHGKGENKKPYVTQRDAFGDLPEPQEAKPKNYGIDNLEIPNHEYYTGSFSSRFMSRNRKRDWDELAYTVEASGRHAKIHPSANDMIKVEKDKWVFGKDSKHPYRRLSVRESARIQTFPDNHIFRYEKVDTGYKMVGNAVPVRLAAALANRIKSDLVKLIEDDSKQEREIESPRQKAYVQKELTL